MTGPFPASFPKPGEIAGARVVGSTTGPRSTRARSLRFAAYSLIVSAVRSHLSARGYSAMRALARSLPDSLIVSTRIQRLILSPSAYCSRTVVVDLTLALSRTVRRYGVATLDLNPHIFWLVDAGMCFRNLCQLA